MYSDRRYSLARYSVNRAEKTVEVAEAFHESLGVLAGAAVPVIFRERYAETCHGSIRGTVSVVSGFSGAAELDVRARMSANVVAGAVLASTLQTAAYGQKNTPAVLAVSETLGASPWASKNIPTGLELEDGLAVLTAGSKDMPCALLASEILTTSFSAISQTTERAVLQVTIPPGGELRIDSELFTVLLNGENVLYAQSGDWINISRELLRLTVESASGGGLEGQMIYTERYL